jgi:RimJ/RimL family protein N-acetyltransferase
MTYLYEAEREGTIFQALTAVDREYRCKGIAKAVKAFAIRRALDAGFTTIYTDNDSRNLAMISINERLGFQRLPGMITLRKELGAVK